MRVGDQVNCTVRVIGEAGEVARVTVELTNATFGQGGGATQTFDCVNTNPPSGTTCQFFETLFPDEPMSGAGAHHRAPPVRQHGAATQDFGIPNAQGVDIEVLPKGTGTCQQPSKTFTERSAREHQRCAEPGEPGPRRRHGHLYRHDYR